MGCSQSKYGDFFYFKENNKCLEYVGEKPINEWKFGVFDYDNSASSICYIGYHKNLVLTGFGQLSTKFKIFQGFFKNQHPSGVCHFQHYNRVEYIGIMKRLREGKGRLRYSNSKGECTYQGFFKKGKQNGIGKEFGRNRFFIGEFQEGFKKFGKYKSISGKTIVSYIGMMKDSKFSGKGVLTKKEYEGSVQLQYNEKTQRIKKTTIIGHFEEGKSNYGVKKTEYRNEENAEKIKNGTKKEYITTKTIPIDEVEKKMNALEKEIIDKYKNLYDSLYFFSLKNISNRFKLEDIKDKTTTIGMKLSNESSGTWFGKGRLCSTKEDLLMSCHEFYFLKLIEDMFQGKKIPCVCPKLCLNSVLDQHSVYDFQYNTPLEKKLIQNSIVQKIEKSI